MPAEAAPSRRFISRVTSLSASRGNLRKSSRLSVRRGPSPASSAQACVKGRTTLTAISRARSAPTKGGNASRLARRAGSAPRTSFSNPRAIPGARYLSIRSQPSGGPQDAPDRMIGRPEAEEVPSAAGHDLAAGKHAGEPPELCGLFEQNRLVQEPGRREEHGFDRHEPGRRRLEPQRHQCGQGHPPGKISERPAIRGVPERLHQRAVDHLVRARLLHLQDEAAAAGEEPIVARSIQQAPEGGRVEGWNRTRDGRRARSVRVQPGRLFLQRRDRHAHPGLRDGSSGLWSKDHVQDDPIVAPVGIVTVVAPARAVQMELDVSDYLLAALGDDNAVAEVRSGPGASPPRVADPEALSVLGDQPLRQGVGALPQ